MRNHLLSIGVVSRGAVLSGLAAVAFVPLVTAGSVAPAVAQTTVAVPGGYVTFTPVQRRYIETYVVRHPVPPAYIPGGFVAEVGAVVPPDVDLRRFGPAPEPYGRYGQAVAQPGYGPDYDDEDGYQTLDEAGYAPDSRLSQYRYVTLPGNEAAVVEPRSRRIILIVE